jgi:hypothetical protein
MRKLILVGLVLASTFSFAQSNSAEEEIKETINNLFVGMRKGDSSIVSNLFYDEARLVSVIRTKDGENWTQNDPVSKFITAIGSPHTGVWNEQISNLEIKIDGALAQAWMDYSFFLDDKFSHCGVNAIQLFHDGESWKFMHIMDTRRQDDSCNTKFKQD